MTIYSQNVDKDKSPVRKRNTYGSRLINKRLQLSIKTARVYEKYKS